MKFYDCPCSNLLCIFENDQILVTVTEVTVCTYTKFHGSLWAHNVWVRVIHSLMSKVSTDLQHTGKVYTFINTMDLFGPTTYVEKSVSSLTPWICLGPQEQERFVDLTTPWVSTDPTCTGKGLFAL